jgi:hypothetical protein
VIELIIFKGYRLYCRLTESLCNRRVPALQVMNGIGVLIYPVNDYIVPKEPMQVPTVSTPRIQNGVVRFISTLHDLIYQVNIRGPYYFFYRIQIIQI